MTEFFQKITKFAKESIKGQEANLGNVFTRVMIRVFEGKKTNNTLSPEITSLPKTEQDENTIEIIEAVAKLNDSDKLQLSNLLDLPKDATLE